MRHERSEAYIAREEARLATTQADDLPNRVCRARAPFRIAGYTYKDRNGKRQFPNPERQLGLVELAKQIYNKGLDDADYDAPYMPLPGGP